MKMKTAKKEVGVKPKISDLVKLEPEIQKRLNALSKINKTTKPQTIAMIINWYFTRIDSTAKQAMAPRTMERYSGGRSVGAA